MKNVIRKIFENESDDFVRADFAKFSRGVFGNRYLLECKKQKDKWAVKSSAEFANYFVRALAEKLNSISVDVKGIIVSTRNLKEVENFSNVLAHATVKQFMSVKQFQINQKMTGEKMIELLNVSPTSFFALTFSFEDNVLKVKAKPPKSGKPGKTDENGPKADFCSLKTSDAGLIGDLFFDFGDFKEIKIKHEINVTNIEIPETAKSPEEMRANAKRTGILKRIVKVDGEMRESEKEFLI